MRDDAARIRTGTQPAAPPAGGFDPRVSVDLAHLRAQELYDVSSDPESIGALIDEAEKTRGWLIFYTHDVRQRPSDIGCSPAYFRTIVDLVRRRGIRVETIAQTLRRIGVAPCQAPTGTQQGLSG